MKVSIVIPTYKRVNYLKRLLKSIEKQTFKNFEIIIVDDCSPNKDEYYQVVEEYKSVFSEFIFLTNNENKGAPYSRNKGIKLAKYNLIALVDDDDEWLPDKLKHQVEIFATKKDVDIVYSWVNAVDKDGKIVYKYRSEIEGNPKYEILRSCFIPSPSVMVKKSKIISAGLFDENLPSCQDWDMWTRMILNGAKVKVVKQVDAIYHKHNDETIGTNNMAYKGFLLYFRKHFFSAFTINPILTIYYVYQGIKIWWRKKA